MVLIETRDVEKNMYQQIHENAVRAGGLTVLILVAPDCDALCSCHILTALLKGDRIQYKVKPVAGYSDIAEVKKIYIDTSEDLKSIIMLNCGSRMNLTKVFNLIDKPDLHCFIVDSHRPVHLANIHSPSQVCVINDGSIVFSDIPQNGSDLDNDSDSDEGSEDDDSDDHDSFDEEDHDFGVENDNLLSGSKSTSFAGKKRKSPVSSLEDNIGGDKKRSHAQIQGQSQQSRRSKTSKRQRRQNIKQYYLLASHGRPSVYTAYFVAQQMSKESNQLLWHAIVGSTSHFMSQRMSLSGYTNLVAEYHEAVKTLNPHSATHATTSSVDKSMRVPIAFDGGIITHEPDFRFMLLRHWSLYNAMFYSDYVGSQLQIWTAEGKQKLQRLLAQVGIPLQDCKQQYSFMSDRMQKRLRDRIREPAERAGLEDIFFETFSLQVGYDRPLTASDLVHIVTALLESRGRAKGSWEQAFYKARILAYDALSWARSKGGSASAPLVEEGLKHSKLLQQAVVAKATMVMEKDMVTFHGHFRCLVLDSMSENDTNIFTQPLALAKLARFIAKAYAAQGTWKGKKGAKPLVMFALDERTASYLVVGVPVIQMSSLLPVAFKYAAQDCGAAVQFEGFDSSVIELPKQSMQAFKMSLYNVFNVH